MALEQELEEAQRKLEGGQSWGLSLVMVEKVFLEGRGWGVATEGF